MREKNPGVSFILSFFIPGLGQFYNERILAGLCFIGSFFILYPLVALVVVAFAMKRPGGILVFVIAIIGYVALWIFNLIHAYKTAKLFNINRRGTEEPLRGISKAQKSDATLTPTAPTAP